MTANTGRTVNIYTEVWIDDSSSTLRQLAVNSIGDIGLAYEEKELYAWFDAVKGTLNGVASFETTISGPLETGANKTHATLDSINGKNVPLTFDVKIGMNHAWEAGEPQFGITATAANGVIVTGYKVNPESASYTATIKMFAGSAAPAWGTAAES